VTRHRLDPGTPFDIHAHATDDVGDLTEEEAEERLAAMRDEISDLFDRLAAEQETAILLVLQGFDGAGKDSVITNVARAIDPAGLHVFDFNTPVGDEKHHDFLWRFHQHTPPWGTIHVFDRSYYEEVISARVHGIVDEETCRARYDSINEFERILTRHGTVILKCFLHVSKDVQAERVLERLRRRDKQHEFSAADVKDRDKWDDYDRAYEDALNATGTEVAPWHAIPADHRWYTNVVVAEILKDALAEIDPQWPELEDDELEKAGISPEDV
jgi:PPK2 family polyphosphate:nucleotide phosphotransferase